MNVKTKPRARDDSRVALSDAIEAARKADADLQAAIAAEERATQELRSAHRALDAIRDEEGETDVDAMIVALSGDDAIAALSRPRAEREAKEAEAQRNVDTLRRAREALEYSLNERREAAKDAHARVDRCISEVCRTNINVTALIETTRLLQDQTLRARCRLMNLQDHLPHDSAERVAISAFMQRAWLLGEVNYGRDPAGEGIRVFAKALASNPDAPAPMLST